MCISVHGYNNVCASVHGCKLSITYLEPFGHGIWNTWILVTRMRSLARNRCTDPDNPCTESEHGVDLWHGYVSRWTIGARNREIRARIPCVLCIGAPISGNGGICARICKPVCNRCTEPGDPCTDTVCALYWCTDFWEPCTAGHDFLAVHGYAQSVNGLSTSVTLRMRLSFTDKTGVGIRSPITTIRSPIMVHRCTDECYRWRVHVRRVIQNYHPC